MSADCNEPLDGCSSFLRRSLHFPVLRLGSVVAQEAERSIRYFLLCVSKPWSARVKLHLRRKLDLAAAHQQMADTLAAASTSEETAILLHPGVQEVDGITLRVSRGYNPFHGWSPRLRARAEIAAWVLVVLTGVLLGCFLPDGDTAMPHWAATASAVMGAPGTDPVSFLSVYVPARGSAADGPAHMQDGPTSAYGRDVLSYLDSIVTLSEMVTPMCN